ncbi:hypothetical protein ANN_18060 [Periplaneta americana]|uniref:Uncharacterized protein n=1 Tax=Periplaneta americana TaxID=6978 RepID=A0ABQ8SMQ9_PERAM|nr:hypothetical protein ANN_18060 [Periplaneta americana]
MAGLREGGNEPPGSLKPSKAPCKADLNNFKGKIVPGLVIGVPGPLIERTSALPTELSEDHPEGLPQRASKVVSKVIQLAAAIHNDRSDETDRTAVFCASSRLPEALAHIDSLINVDMLSSVRPDVTNKCWLQSL